MSLDLIKQYLVGIGFEVDSESFELAGNSMEDATKKVENFNENSTKGFSETGDSLKSLFSLISSSGTLGKLFPGLSKPFKDIIEEIKVIKKLYDEISGTNSNSSKEERPKSSKTEAKEIVKEKVIEKVSESNVKVTDKEIVKEKIIKKTPEPKAKIPEPKVKTLESNVNVSGKEAVKEKIVKKASESNNKAFIDSKPKTLETVKNSIENMGEASKTASGKVSGLKNGISSLATKGGSSLKAFATASVASIALVAVAVVGLIVGIKKLASYLNGLAEKDIEYEKLSRMLWTTKETAKEVSQALETLGVTMEDLWLSPTLLKQFNQLRKDSSQLKIPPEFYDNLKVIQGIGFEFKRLKQLMSLLFQWIGHYILKYLAGPLTDVKKGMGDFNNWLIQNIPKVAEIIGFLIGSFLRLLFVLGKVLIVFLKVLSPIFKLIEIIGKANKEIDKLPEGFKKAARLIVSYLAVVFAPILLIIALIDDLLTFLRGGKSVMGDFAKSFGGKWGESIEKLKKNLAFLKDLLKKFKLDPDAKDEWNSYGQSAKENLEKIISWFEGLETSFSEGMLTIKDEWSTYADRASESLNSIREKAKGVWGDIQEWSKGALEKGLDFLKGDDKDKIVRFEKNHGSNSEGTINKSYLTNKSSTSNRTTNTNNEVSNQNTINVYSNDATQAGNVISKRLTGITSRNLQGVVE